MFNSSVFSEQEKSIEPDPDARIIFVSDLFVSDYVGGAELTTQALINSSPLRIQCIRSRQLTIELMEKLKDRFWVFGNFSQVPMDLLPTVIANLDYSILEYDYKYCKYRSPQKHEMAENEKCNCHSVMHGKLISAFYYGARSLWWMSEKQMDHYHTLFPFLSDRPNTVLSSVFDDQFFLTLKLLRKKYEDYERTGYIVLGSQSWVKGANAAQQHCEENMLPYEVVWNLPYDQVLEKLAQAEGFVYLPAGWDTCPRMVIEAKLLGC